jgi:hypothetical protein
VWRKKKGGLGGGGTSLYRSRRGQTARDLSPLIGFCAFPRYSAPFCALLRQWEAGEAGEGTWVAGGSAVAAVKVVDEVS